MKKTIGILAHVDAGKTTFSEAILWHTHSIRAAGRVDHGDAFLDAHPLERQRGITIFSDQAFFEYEGDEYYWMDTPGHVDFSPEMERAISVMDYAVVIVSAAEGVQSHTRSIWKLLESYRVPVFLFVNKTDRPGADFEKVLAQMKKRLSGDIVSADDLSEAAAERDEALLEDWLSGRYDAQKWTRALIRQIAERQLFPVYRGSALKGEGIEAFLNSLHVLTQRPEPQSAPFRAQVYKIRHDSQGERICFFKVLSGTLSPREEILLPGGGTVKAGEIRRYHGAKYKPLPRASAGDDVALSGIPSVMPGDIIGRDACSRCGTRTEPMMAVSAVWQDGVPVTQALSAFKALEDEEPTLHVAYTPATRSIDLKVMGPIQLEVIKELMRTRFSLDVSFGPMRVLYMETVAEPVDGIGHYEPLRHYAEVHLRLVPLPRGSGIRFLSRVHVDDLTLNWQRLIETHVFEKTHKGVLIGAPLTDVQVELTRGRAHLKHTEGGDFREATYRAIRNALMYAQSVLLEPVCRFEITAPADLYGRLQGDLTRRNAVCDPPEMDGDGFAMTGEVPFSDIALYHTEFLAATHGKGSFQYSFAHYAPCHNAAEVIEAAGYDPLAGDDPPHSVFCAHGGGFTVPWDQVKNYAHLG